MPPFAELGLKGYEADTWFGLVGPANMPKDVVKKIYDAAILALKDPETVKTLDDNGAFALGNTPEQFTEQIKREVAKWKRVVDVKKISLDM